ncbi:MAG TPA: SRPBCC family protein [Acidimicrobiales bacterium]|nr:SRPBCC family protein [Acidimicrobiales bacterium]
MARARGSKVVSVERVIPAPAQRLFDVVADPAMHSVIDGSGTVKALRKGSPERLSLGARFGIAMRIGVPYPITNTVVEFEEGRQLAWEHIGRARWRYCFEPVDAGTRVTESWDFSPSPRWLALGYRLLRFPSRNRPGMERTLEQLESHVRSRQQD